MVIVEFEGDGSGVAELSWGQFEIWSVMRDKGDSLPISGFRATMVAARLGLSTSPVLLAAFVVALTPLTRSPHVALHLVVSNRFRPRFAGSVSPVAQSCLCVIEVAGAPFEEVARWAWQSALGSYKHAYFDLAGKIEVCERLAAERGAELDWGVFFNDRRVRSRELADAVPGDEDGGARRRGSRRRDWTQTQGRGGDMSDSALRERVMESIHVVLPKVLALDAKDAAELSERTRLMEDLGMTSAATLELMLELEDSLDIQIDVEEIEPADLASVGALADFVAGHVEAD
jgi:acyl carrier protein